MKLHPRWLVSMIWLYLFSTGTTGADTILELRSEFRINRTTVHSQDHATVALSQDGQLVVVWHTETPEKMKEIRTSYRDRFRFSPEYPVNYPQVVNDQRVPDIATNQHGDYVVVWSSETTAGHNVMARLFSSNTRMVGAEFQVNDLPSGKQHWPDAAMFDNGDFIVTWEQREGNEIIIYAQLFDATGVPVGEHQRVSQVPSYDLEGLGQAIPDIAVCRVNGEEVAVATWSRKELSLRAVVAVCRFTPYTRALGPEIEVDGARPSGMEQKRPMVDINGKGDILVAWVEKELGESAAVRAVKYDGATYPAGGMFHELPDNDLYEQNRITAKLFDSGSGALLWDRDTGAPNQRDLLMMIFDADGNPSIPKPYLINSDETTQHFDQSRPALDCLEVAEEITMAITWQSQGQDGGQLGVFGKLLLITP